MSVNIMAASRRSLTDKFGSGIGIRLQIKASVRLQILEKVKLRKETPVMMYVHEITNLPFLVTLAKIREE
jgi:hypothetical protein